MNVMLYLTRLVPLYNSHTLSSPDPIPISTLSPIAYGKPELFDIADATADFKKSIIQAMSCENP